MKAWLILVFRESQQLLRLRFAFLWASIWLGSLGFWSFFYIRLMDSGEASLRRPLQILPWLLIVLMPLVARQLWHKDARPGYEEWLQIAGFGGLKRISAQCLAGALVSFCLMISTIPLALTVMLLGPLDKGIWLSSLLGLWLLSLWQLALSGLFMRIYRQNGTAILMSILSLGLLQVLGLPEFVDQLTRMFHWLPGHILQACSPLTHLDTLMRGVVDNRNLSFFVGGSLWLLAAQVLLQRKQRSVSFRGSYVPPRSFWILLDIWLLIGFLFVALAQRPFLRFDLSDERLYSLSEGSRSLLKVMQNKMTIRLYFSRSHPLMDPMLRIHGHRVQELLEAYLAYAPDKIQLDVIDPIPDTAVEADARWEGLRGVRSAQGDVFLGAVFNLGKKTLRIPFFDPRKEAQIEYELSEAFVKLNQTVKPSLGIITSLPLVSERSDDGPRLRQDWAVVEALRGFYQITRLPLDVTSIPETISSLLVVHPKNISELTEYAIDQFILRGGHLVVAIDPFCETELSYNTMAGNGNGGAMRMSSTLPRLLAAWGVEFDSSRMVGDTARTGRQTTLQRTSNNPFLVNLQPQDINRQHQITRAIQQVLFPEPGWFEVKTKPDQQWEVLAQSSDKSGLLSTDSASYMSAQQLTQQLKPDGTIRTIAGILSGPWTSAFAEQPAGSPVSEHRTKSADPNSVVLFADTDFLADPYAVEKLQVMSQMLIRPRNDNVSLLTHAVEFLSGNRDLISIRSGGSLHRPLTHLESMEEIARQPFVEQEEKLSARIADIEKQIGDLQVQEENSASILSKDQQQDLRRLREVEAGLWTERRLVREKARAKPDQWRRLIVGLHVGLLPLGMIALGFWLRMRDSQKAMDAIKQLHANSQFI